MCCFYVVFYIYIVCQTKDHIVPQYLVNLDDVEPDLDSRVKSLERFKSLFTLGRVHFLKFLPTILKTLQGHKKIGAELPQLSPLN